MEHIKILDDFTPKGRVIVRGYRAGAIAAAETHVDALKNVLSLERQSTTQVLKRYYAAVARGLKQKIDEIFAEFALGIETASDNLIMTGSLTGRDLLIQYLINGTTYTGGINYGSFGTGTTTPASTDTRLTAEVARVAPSLGTDINYNEAQLQFFFPDANLANNTYHEVGTFMNGSATLNSGKIFNHALLGTPYTKTTGVDTTLQVNITLN